MDGNLGQTFDVSNVRYLNKTLIIFMIFVFFHYFYAITLINLMRTNMIHFRSLVYQLFKKKMLINALVAGIGMKNANTILYSVRSQAKSIFSLVLFSSIRMLRQNTTPTNC